jgi:hypothetical protein
MLLTSTDLPTVYELGFLDADETGGFGRTARMSTAMGSCHRNRDTRTNLHHRTFSAFVGTIAACDEKIRRQACDRGER